MIEQSRQFGPRRFPGARAFSLIEILVAVALMSVIMLGLLSMFYQTQRALRFGSSQVDILESGRTSLQYLVSEIEQAAPSHAQGVINFAVTNAMNGDPLTQPRIDGDPHTNILQDLFFISRLNDDWIGTGYFVDIPVVGVGTLYRWETNVPLANANLLWGYFQQAINTRQNLHRAADRITHMRVLPYDTQGEPSTNVTVQGNAVFTGGQIPAYVDVELGFLEPKAFERFRALTNNPTSALHYLTGQVDRVHLFRRRVPIRAGL